MRDWRPAQSRWEGRIAARSDRMISILPRATGVVTERPMTSFGRSRDRNQEAGTNIDLEEKCPGHSMYIKL